MTGDIHPVHMKLLNRFGTDSNQFGRHVNARKNVQTDLAQTCSKVGLEPI